MIRYLSHTEIDRNKWDNCISNAVFETIYPYSWYLDVTSPGWYALVEGEYERIMPLTWKRKYGIRMLMQPPLTQQLGIFAAQKPDADKVREFMRSISQKYLLVDICLNQGNQFEGVSVRQEARHNYELDISDPGLDPEKHYTTNTRRNIQKGQTSQYSIKKMQVNAYLDLKFSLKENSGLKKYQALFERLYRSLENEDRAEVFGLYLGSGLHAAAVLGYSGSRSVYLNGCSTEEGKNRRSMFVLMDHMIRMRVGQHRIFDFEGSNIPVVARFFKGFGAVREVYPRIMRTPFQIRSKNV